jgi:pantetheine-phosphate adenylyltransferase
MAIALYPGTFDPITLGHIDIVKRASQIFSKVVTVVADNKSKKCLFSLEDRLHLAKESLKDFPSVEVITYDGLIIDAVKEYGASTIIRGLRALSDFDYEFQLAFTNRQLDDKADTVFLMPSAQFTYLSSSMVRQLAQFNGDISQFVTPVVESAFSEKF